MSFKSQNSQTSIDMNESTMTQKSAYANNKQFNSSTVLKQHNINVYNEIRIYKCGTCDKTFNNKTQLRHHERIHTGERPYQCEFCEKAFVRKEHLNSHKEAKHMIDKNYKCIVCEKVFKTRNKLRYHTDTIHPREGGYKCNQCLSTFIDSEKLKQHIKMHGDKYLCEFCGKIFIKLYNLKSHSFIHSDEKSHECLLCGKSFGQKAYLSKHIHRKDTSHKGQYNDEQTATDNQIDQMQL